MSIVAALDSGAIIALANGKREVLAMIRTMIRSGHLFVVAAPVLAETLRGTPKTDAAIHQWLKAFSVEPTTKEIAMRAGQLLGAVRSKETVDALIVATARARSAALLVTGDLAHMAPLVDGSMEILVI